MYLLSQLKRYANTQVLKIFFWAHILPHINYASFVWDGCADDHIKKLNSLHRRAAKLMLAIPNMSTEEKMLSLNILPLEKQFIFNKALIVYKTLHNQTPSYMQSLLQTASSRYNSQKLLPPLPRIDLYKTSLAFSSSVVYIIIYLLVFFIGAFYI